MKNFFLFFIFALMSFSAFAQEESLSLCAQGKYFSIYGYRGLDNNSLLTKVNYSYFGNIDTILGEDDFENKSSLAGAIDGLYSEVSDILDIHMYSFHGKIMIVPDRNYIGAIAKSYLGMDFPERSFYLFGENTIYISFSDLTVGMLGHEIAHAIISHYFVVPPSAKVQEVLCGYVEYKLQKNAGK